MNNKRRSGIFILHRSIRLAEYIIIIIVVVHCTYMSRDFPMYSLHYSPVVSRQEAQKLSKSQNYFAIFCDGRFARNEFDKRGLNNDCKKNM